MWDRKSGKNELAFIRPMEYCVALWNNCTRKTQDKSKMQIRTE